jgi:hypothetical protein
MTAAIMLAVSGGAQIQKAVNPSSSTEPGASAIEKAARENRTDLNRATPAIYNQARPDGGTTWVSPRQSLPVVDPPDGRVPAKPSAEAQREYDLVHVADFPAGADVTAAMRPGHQLGKRFRG